MPESQHKLPPGWRLNPGKLSMEILDASGEVMATYRQNISGEWAAWEEWECRTGIARSEFEKMQTCKRVMARILGADHIYLQDLFEAILHTDGHGHCVGVAARPELAKALGFASVKEAHTALTEADAELSAQSHTHRRELVLRHAIIDIMCSLPDQSVGGRLRTALTEAYDPGAHPEDRCEECRDEFETWVASHEDWETVTGRNWGGPILCRKCFDRRITEAETAKGGDADV